MEYNCPAARVCPRFPGGLVRGESGTETEARERAPASRRHFDSFRAAKPRNINALRIPERRTFDLKCYRQSKGVCPQPRRDGPNGRKRPTVLKPGQSRSNPARLSRAYNRA